MTRFNILTPNTYFFGDTIKCSVADVYQYFIKNNINIFILKFSKQFENQGPQQIELECGCAVFKQKD